MFIQFDKSNLIDLTKLEIIFKFWIILLQLDRDGFNVSKDYAIGYGYEFIV